MEDSKRKPLSARRIGKAFRARKSEQESPISVDWRFYVAGSKKPPKVKAKAVRVEGRDTQYEVIVEVDGVRAGARAFPRAMHGTPVKRSRKDQRIDVDDALLQGLIPKHLTFNPVLRERVRSYRTFNDRLDRKIVRPTTVFQPDDREVFQDTSYPWGRSDLSKQREEIRAGL